VLASALRAKVFLELMGVLNEVLAVEWKASIATMCAIGPPRFQLVSIAFLHAARLNWRSR
jgi:hypothetical protein